MRILKILGVILALALVTVLVAGCNGSDDTDTTTATRNVAVTIGTVSNEVTGTASLALSKTQDLAFDMAGTVDEVLVEAGETVTAGQELVKLNTSVWEDELTTLERAVTTAQRNVTSKESALVKAQRAVYSQELAKRSKDLDLESAEDSLYQISEVKAAKDVVDKAQLALDTFKASMEADILVNPGNITTWNTYLTGYQDSLTQATANLNAVLAGTNVSISSSVAIQIARAQISLEQAKIAAEDAATAIEEANTAVDNAELDLEDAKKDLQTAQDKLSESQGFSPIITAPFDGFITSISVKGGDDVLKGKVALQIADPDQFEAAFMVSETDIFNIKVGQSAVVSIDALDNQSFPATITTVAPLATNSSGVVSYQVTAELTSLVPISGGGTSVITSGGSISIPDGFTPGQMPEGFTPGTLPEGVTPDGNMPTTMPTEMTEEMQQQIQERLQEMQDQQSGESETAEPVTLKQGLTATVTVTIESRSNVLVVPNRALSKSAGIYTVQVVDGDKTETRQVTVGLADSSYTEITSGLSEGEIVVVKTSSSTSSSGMMMPGSGSVVVREVTR